MTPGFVLKDATVSINGTDVSALIREVHVVKASADVDATGMRSGGSSEHKHGLRSDSFSFVAKSTFGAEGLNELCEPLHDEEVEFEVLVNPFPLPTTENNPQYGATCILLTFNPIDASVGALSTTPLTIPCQERITKVYT